MSKAAFTRGALNQALLGLDRYPAAGMMVAMDALRGGVAGKKLSYKQALAEIRELERFDEEENPKARMAGQVVGGIANAATTGGASLLPIIGRTALQGGVLGFTEKEGMDGTALDTLKGAGTGAVMGAAGGLVGKGIDAARKVAGRLPEVQNAHLDKLAGRYEANKTIVLASDAAKARRAASKVPLTDDQVVNSLAKGGGKTLQLAADDPVRKAAQKASAQRVGWETSLQKMQAGTWKPTDYALVPAAMGDARLAMDILKNTAGGTITGGVIGGAAGAAGGMDPFDAAQAGALAGGLWQSKAKLGEGVTKLGLGAATALRPRLAESGARLGTASALPVVLGGQPPVIERISEEPVVFESNDWQWEDADTGPKSKKKNQEPVFDDWVWQK